MLGLLLCGDVPGWSGFSTVPPIELSARTGPLEDLKALSGEWILYAVDYALLFLLIIKTTRTIDLVDHLLNFNLFLRSGY